MKKTSKHPPRLAVWLLAFLKRYEAEYSVSGDFYEEFREIMSEGGKFKAYLWFWGQVLYLIPTYITLSILVGIARLENYLKVALRCLKRHKGYSFINIAGLTIGMSCSIIIAIFVFFELSFDRYHENASQIYRVGAQFGPTTDMRGAFTAPPVAQALMDDFPEVIHAVRYSPWPRNYLISYGEKKFLEKGIKYADAGFFDVFTIPFVHGNPDNALSDPCTVVITEEIAQKYFRNKNPLGKSLRFEDRQEVYKITGVVEDCPANSHFQFDMIASFITRENSRDTGWMGHSLFTYIILQEGVAPSQLEEKFPDFILRHYGPQFFAQTGVRYEDHLRDEKNYYGYFVEPLLDIHLNSQILDNQSVKGDIIYIYVFSIIAVFTLLLACINYMNLSTARFAHRSKEVGIRKVLGSEKRQLISQFIGESILLSFIALVLSVLIVKAVLPAFSNLAERQLDFDLFGNIYVLPVLIGYALLVGVLAGSYPAFFLSSLKPVSTMRVSSDNRARSNLLLRRTLVILQFSITVFIFIGTFVISSQLKYIRNMELGFEKEQVLVIPRAYTLGKQAATFKRELLNYPNILAVSGTDSLPGRHFNPNGHRLEGRPLTEEHTLYTMYGDCDFVELIGLEIVEGRYFSRGIPTDATSAVVINEMAVRELGLSDPIGKRFHKEFGGAKEGEFVTIIGVLKDFHFLSLHHEILPMIIRPLSEEAWFYTSIKVRPENIKETISLIKKTWANFSGGQPLEYSFLDEDFNSLYKTEKRTEKISTIFFLLAGFIACLGLLGLVSFAAQQRTKEIGIRKVLGAPVFSIIYLLSKEVIVLVAISTLIASPIAYYVMFNWLQNFAYRIDITPWMFVLTASAILFMALITISFQAVKAAIAYPVNSLRYE